MTTEEPIIETTPQDPPKKRGRPRKYPPKDPNAPKRPRGRPKKSNKPPKSKFTPLTPEQRKAKRAESNHRYYLKNQDKLKLAQIDRYAKASNFTPLYKCDQCDFRCVYEGNFLKHSH